MHTGMHTLARYVRKIHYGLYAQIRTSRKGGFSILQAMRARLCVRVVIAVSV